MLESATIGTEDDAGVEAETVKEAGIEENESV